VADPTPTPSRARRVAYLSFSIAEFDARTLRMARTARAAGYEVVVYARWKPGLPVTEDRDGILIVRASSDWRLIVPGLRAGARRRVSAAMAAAPQIRSLAVAGSTAGALATPRPPRPARPARPLPIRLLSVVVRPFAALVREPRRLIRLFPAQPHAWASSLEGVAEPADVWHGMWAGSLPALGRLRRRHGGRTIYDSRDVFLQSRGFATAPRLLRAVLAGLERRWARAADRVITVNDDYARLLADQLGIAPPAVVRNLPERWTPPTPRPDRLRAAIGADPSTRIVLYQGGFLTGRGIEPSMEAILEVPDAVLVLLGFGALREQLIAATAAPPFRGKVAVLDPVSPDDLLAWTASADVSVMAIQPSSPNHAFTTPQKLFESLAAGVPVVAADLPGMARIVAAEDVGVLVDPTSPAAIAARIRSLLDAPSEDRARLRAHVLAVAHERYAWETDAPRLLTIYDELIAASRS